MRVWIYIILIGLMVYCAVFPAHIVQLIDWLFND
jgi:hypothetical protein